MAQPAVKQFRYYNNTSSLNTPSTIDTGTEENPNPWLTNILEGYNSVIKIGIQTLPGTVFFLNDNLNTDGIIIDHTGVYELDLRNLSTVIYSLKFDGPSLAAIDAIDNANIIVDILYNNIEGTVNS